MPFLPPNQQRQSTEGTAYTTNKILLMGLPEKHRRPQVTAGDTTGELNIKL